MPIAASVSASAGKQAEQPAREARRGLGAVDDIGHRADRRDRQRRVHRGDLVANRADEGHRIAGRLHHERHVPDGESRGLRELRVRPVELFLHHRSEAVVLKVGDDADDRDPGPLGVRAHADAPADRVAVFPVERRHLLVDDRHLGRVRAIGRP